MLRYLFDIVEFDDGDAQAGLARTVFALTTIHAARLNLTELMRTLARAANPSTRELGSSDELTSQRHLVLATVQIAIDQTLRSPTLKERMDASPSFAQLATDTLYYPSRTWESGTREVDPSPEALRDHLLARRHASDETRAGTGGDTPAEIPADALDLLQVHLVEMLTSLGDLAALRASLGTRNASGEPGDPQAGDARLSDVPPRDVEAIVKDLEDGRFQFAFSPAGEPVVALAGRFDTAQRAEAEQVVDYARALQELVADAGTTIDDLARTPLIATVGDESVERAIEAVTIALRRGSQSAAVEQQLSVLRRLHSEATEQADRLGELLILVRSLARDVEDGPPIVPAVARLVRLEREPRQWLRNTSGRPALGLPTDAEALRRWTRDYTQWLAPAPGQGSLSAPFDFPWLLDGLRRTILQPRRNRALVPDYATLVQALRGLPPAASLAWDLSKLSAGDWSRLALSAVPTRTRPASSPYWVLLAALRGLGFGKPALSYLAAPELAQELSVTSFKWMLEGAGLSATECFAIAGEFADGAPDRPGGILVVEQEDERIGSDRPSAKRPVLIVDAREFPDYQPALNWFLSNGILTGQAIGLAQGTEAET